MAMWIPKLTCGVMKGFSRRLEVRPLLTIFFTAVFVCSVQIDSSDCHDSIIVHRDCPICKYLAIFPSGSEAAVQQMVAPDFVNLLPALENLLIFSEVLITVPDTRAPPYSFF